MKRTLSLVLVLVLLLGLFPTWTIRAEAASGDNIEAIVREQIVAYANSITQAKSYEDAAMALANHAILKRGANLNVGQSHVLTACLYDSNHLRNSLPILCADMIQTMQDLGMTSMWGAGGITWHSYNHSYSVNKYPNSEEVRAQQLGTTTSKTRYGDSGYPGPFNDQDNTLLWAVGGSATDIDMRQVSSSRDKVTYKVKVKISDRFDFTSNYDNVKGDATFEKVGTLLGSTMGKLMFTEFDWVSTTEFTLTVPNTCSHSSGNYHWVYDPAGNQMISDGSGEFLSNTVTPILYSTTNSTTGVTTSYYYYKLEDTVHLRHDKPWVMEYTVQKSGNIAFTPVDSSTSPLPFLVQISSALFSAAQVERIVLTEEEKEAYGFTSKTQTRRYFYSTPLKDLFKWSNKYVYQFHLENVIHEDGSNMIYLTVYNETLQETVLDQAALDDFYFQDMGEKTRTYQGVESDWVSGKDFLINYIGCKGYKLSPEMLDITIMENGKGVPSADTFAKKENPGACGATGSVTYTCTLCGCSETANDTENGTHNYVLTETVPATCTADGYSTYTCACGDSYQDNFTEKVGHSYTPAVTNPTCTAEGYTTYTCSCGDSYVDSNTDALGHAWDNGVVTKEATEDAEGVRTCTCTRCGETKTESIPKVEHVHKYTDNVTAPTCKDKGYTTHTCACGDSYVDSHTDALGHSWDNGVVTKEATEEAEGVRTYTCTRCGETKTESIPKLEHVHKYTNNVTAPTCTDKGYTTHTCRCGDSYVDSYVEPTGHSFGAWKVTKTPTLTEKGIETRMCACGEKETREIEVVEYKIGDVNGDGEVNSDDAALICYYDAELIPVTALLLSFGDVNGDGFINSDDAALICYMDAELIDYNDFPCFKK